MNTKPLDLRNKVEGHIIKYAKGHYGWTSKNKIEDLRRIIGCQVAILHEHVRDCDIWSYMVNCFFLVCSTGQRTFLDRLFLQRMGMPVFCGRATFEGAVDDLLGCFCDMVVYEHESDEKLVLLPADSEEIKAAMGENL